MICCEQRSDEALVLLKSAVLFSLHADFEAYIIADDSCRLSLMEEVMNLVCHLDRITIFLTPYST